MTEPGITEDRPGHQRESLPSMADGQGRGDWPNLDALLTDTAREVAAEDATVDSDPLRCADHPDADVTPAARGWQCTACRMYVCVRCGRSCGGWTGRCDDCEREVCREQARASEIELRRTRRNAVNAAVFLEQENAMLAAAVRDAAEALEDAEESMPFSSTVHERNVDRARGILNGALARLDGAP